MQNNNDNIFDELLSDYDPHVSWEALPNIVSPVGNSVETDGVNLREIESKQILRTHCGACLVRQVTASGLITHILTPSEIIERFSRSPASPTITTVASPEPQAKTETLPSIDNDDDDDGPASLDAPDDLSDIHFMPQVVPPSAPSAPVQTQAAIERNSKIDVEQSKQKPSAKASTRRPRKRVSERERLWIINQALRFDKSCGEIAKHATSGISRMQVWRIVQQERKRIVDLHQAREKARLEKKALPN